jgi:hypothetical protein
MSNRNDRVKELTERLNYLRLQRREIAKKERIIHNQLSAAVSEPTQAGPVRNSATPNESKKDGNTNRSPSKETPIKNEKGLQLKTLEPDKKLKKGETLYIVNEISHFRERNGGKSIQHRLGEFCKETPTGRIYIVTRSGNRVWRLRKNLKLVTARDGIDRR